MKFLRSRRGIAALAALVLILFLFRPGVQQLRYRIAGSIGSALGRKVTIENVRVHLLPRPGFDLKGLVIRDDPSFSAEPMIRAHDVSAAIRFRSLLRGRLEIATLSATEPSINLVRNDQGRWNLAGLLERSARIPTAPTGKSASEPRPAFPYLEASHARINFKLGQAKKSWALTDADVALWQDSENSWGARMRAQPVRTDFNLTDTGLIRINATWERAASLSETPVQMALQWDRGQLGQVTKLFTGRDRGWRGDTSVSANLSGTPRALQIKSQLRVDDFRRYDIMSSGSVRLSSTCSGRYSAVENLLEDLSCESPVSGGSVRLRGSFGPVSALPAYDLTLTAENVPLSSGLQVLRRAKKELPADLAATGHLDAEFHAVSDGSKDGQISGSGEIADARLSSNSGKDEIKFGDVPFAFWRPNAKLAKGTRSAKARDGRDGEPAEAHLLIGAFPLAMGATGPATASGWVSASGYRLSLRGDTDLKNLFRLAATLGLAGSRPVAEGSARVDLGVTGPWQGFAAPEVFGTAQLRRVRAGMHGLNPPIEIASAIVRMDPEAVSLEKLSAQTGDTHWSGNVKAPRHCASLNCVFHFDLSVDELSSAGLVEWFTPTPAKRPWYKILTSSEPKGASPLLAIKAQGTLRANRMRFKKVEATQISTQVELDHGKVTLSGLSGQILQGTHQGKWVVDFSAQPARFQGAGTLLNIALPPQKADANERWVTGVADARFDLTSSGSTFPDLLTHSDGELTFTLRNGAFPNLELTGGMEPLAVRRFSGILNAKNGAWTLSAGKLESQDGAYEISGTASAANGLNFVLKRGSDLSWRITGTLLKPIVAHATRTQASRKP